MNKKWTETTDDCNLHLFQCFCCFLFHRLWVGVEDAQSDNYIPINVVVSLSMTIAQLKEKVITTNSDVAPINSVLSEGWKWSCLLPNTCTTLSLSMIPSFWRPSRRSTMILGSTRCCSAGWLASVWPRTRRRYTATVSARTETKPSSSSSQLKLLVSHCSSTGRTRTSSA